MRTTLTGAVVALALAVTACGFGTSSESTSTTAVIPETTTTSAEPTATTEGAAQTTTTTLAPPTEDAALLETIDELIEITEQVRGLAFLEEPTITVVTEEELSERVRTLIEEELDPEETAQSEALFELLGILDPEVNLADLYTDLYAEQVAGYYDGDTEEMVIPSGQELTSLQKLTVVHELTHALTDQHFDFSMLSDRLNDEEQYEEAAALQALVEGDASWAELIYLQTFMTAGEQAEVFADAGEIETGVLDATPDFIRDLLIFPYDFEGGGASFVAELWLEDRTFSRVDEAYANPPTTTEQIVDPDRYLAAEDAVDVQLPETMIDGYEVVDEGMWGQVGFEFLFAESLSDEDAERASVGWGGDEYRVLWDGEQILFVVLFTGDDAIDNTEMTEVLEAFVEAQIPATTSTYVGATESEVLFIASDGADVDAFATTYFGGF